MNQEQHLNNLLNEVDLILKTELVLQRKRYFEGARDYLLTLKQLIEDESVAPKPRKKRESKLAIES